MPQLARCAQSPATPNRSPWPASPRPTTARCRQSEAEIDALLLLAPARSPPPSAPRSCARSASTGPGNNRATVPVDRHGPGPCPVARHRLKIALHYPHPIRCPFPAPHTWKNSNKLRHLEAASYLIYLILYFVKIGRASCRERV